jgi:hypothetical protein
VVITNNVISQSADQLLLIQDDVGGINDRMQVTNNLIVGAGAAAIQVSGTRHFKMVGNTVWDSKYGVFVRRGATGLRMNGAVLRNNVIDQLNIIEGVKLKGSDYNFVGASQTPRQPHEIRGGNPGFANQAGGDYHPITGSVLIGRAERGESTPNDLEGTKRADPGTLGALEPELVPSPTPQPIELPGATPPVQTSSTNTHITTIPIAFPALPALPVLPTVPVPAAPGIPHL